jgi:hypothetical protein
MRLIVPAFAIAFVWGYAAALIGDAVHLNTLVAPASTAIPLAAFAWFYRDREFGDVAMPAAFVSFASYVGLALVRFPQLRWPESDHFAVLHVGPVSLPASLGEHWPFVLAACIPFVFIFTMAVAVPVSMITVRRKPNTRSHDDFLAWVEERNAKVAVNDPPR